ncbi:hypothetical protein [Methylobacter psychrophilus]|uniref:hypothetical protein n=1 Tax=Methylobacter psychrophilus TaxID=96941 RepID=UPI0021D4C596|nr:hypothetical protein [Methylobacter psychrophilus]
MNINKSFVVVFFALIGNKDNKTMHKSLPVKNRDHKSVISIYRQSIFYASHSLTEMKNYGTWLLLVFLLSGCVTEPVKPSSDTMAQIHTILVVPVESPPLEVIPDLIQSRFPVYRQYQYQALPHSVFLEKHIYKSSGGVLIAGLVSKDDSVSVADLNQSPDSTEKTASLKSLVSLSGNWTPTFMLAQEAVSQLNGDRVKAILSTHYYRLPMAGGDSKADIGNWHKTIRQWYNQNLSPVDYRQLNLEHIDAVLEVGIETYRIFAVQTSLQVLIKLIDPNTGQVIGKISTKTFSAEDSPQTLLNHDAEKFKQLVTEMGKHLITRGANQLGLPLKATDPSITLSPLAIDTVTP